MEDKLILAQHTEQLKTLFKRVDNMENIGNAVHGLDKNMAVQTQMLQSIVEHNAKQDKRMDEQHQINIKVNDNLTILTEKYTKIDDKVNAIDNKTEELTKKVEVNEEKNTIDLRDINKKKYMDFIFRYALPTSGGIILLLELIKILKGYA